MDDPVTATAKAVEETAKATGKALEIFDKVFGDLAGNAVGISADWIDEQRKRLKDRWCRQTAKILEDRNVREFIQLSPNLAAALVEGAQEETREELVDLWARLLANAVDPRMNNVRRRFIDIMKEMDPPDALVLVHFYKRKLSAVDRNSSNDFTIVLSKLAEELGKSPDDVEASLNNLIRIGLFINRSSNWEMTVEGRVFLRACYPEIGS